MKAVTLEIRFHELFESKDPVLRRERWEEWKVLAKEAGALRALEDWTDASECLGCAERDGDWCAFGLPCTVNPILSFRHGLVGMACIGLGYSPNYSQTEQVRLPVEDAHV